MVVWAMVAADLEITRFNSGRTEPRTPFFFVLQLGYYLNQLFRNSVHDDAWPLTGSVGAHAGPTNLSRVLLLQLPI